MDAIFNSIDEACEFSIIRYNHTPDGQDYFYLLELSALQVLREIPFDTPLKVTKIFSQRQRIAQKTDSILATQTVKNFLDITIPLVDNGCLPCDDLNILIDRQIDLLSHNDGEVHLYSNEISKLRDLMKRILGRQSFSIAILDEILANSNQYLKLERPNKILAKYDTFDEVIENS
jgi:hypothetical protein